VISAVDGMDSERLATGARGSGYVDAKILEICVNSGIAGDLSSALGSAFTLSSFASVRSISSCKIFFEPG